MDHVNTLRDYGLFDAKVPRYTSYPPANRFQPGIGAQYQGARLADLAEDEPVSVYVHIPFCRRLCWFCACRTQGTRTLSPVDTYLDRLTREIALAAAGTPGPRKLARLHLGGGTPTLLSATQIHRLLDVIERHFTRTPDCEFSVEIDPTEAAPATLDALAARDMRRASIGVQDFATRVQQAIGRQQSCDETHRVVERLRRGGVRSLNIDLLYGLPYQTPNTLLATLQEVDALGADRLALYGYAHVPHMSKRQKLIPSDALPSAEQRFDAARKARAFLEQAGYLAIGIDHFARPTDSLAHAARTGTLRRNFQGYTDDPCATLIGFGASAISRFRDGYVQNAVATPAYQQQIDAGRLPGHKGYVLTPEDNFLSDMVDQIMCEGCIDARRLAQSHAALASEIPAIFQDLLHSFPKALRQQGDVLRLCPGTEALARVLAARLDVALHADHLHSAAI